jgi:3'-5' exoribonuclease
LTSKQVSASSKKTGSLISEIREFDNGTQVKSCFCVKYRRPLRKYAIDHFRFDVGLADKSGEIELTYWGGQDEETVKAIYDSFKADDIVYVSGKIGEFHGKRIDVNEGRGEIRQANPREYVLDDFIVRTNQDIEELWSKIIETKESLDNPHLKNLLNAFFSDKGFVRDFKKAPAAITIHHACLGGLLEHTWEVLRYCEAVASVHPSLDKSLLFTGAILHDIGKIEEYKISMSIKQSKKGMLVGHTYIGTELILKKISELPDFPPLLKNKLIHMILSHSGKEEYGAGQEPKLPEAAALHYADEMGAKITQYIRAKKDAVTDDFRSPWNRRIGSVFLE